MTRRRVILDALLVDRRPAGVARSALELVRALASTDRGLDFTVAATAPEMFSFLDGVPGWSVVDCPGARGGVLRKVLHTQTALPRLCRRLGADLLHSLQFVAPLRPPCSLVVTVHDLSWQLYPGTIEPLRRWFYGLVVPPVLRRAAAVVASSAATTSDVCRLHPAVADRVVSTPLGTPSWVWRQAGAGTLPAEPAAGRSRFLYVGTLEPRKNLEGLLAAYEYFLESAREAGKEESSCPSLVFVGGRGWRDSRLRRRISDLRSRGHLEVREYCGAEELWELYRTSHGLVFPSLHEGFGFPVLEAMAAGLPVLTSGRGATAEVAGDAALLVDPDARRDLAASLADLAWNDDLRADLRARGLARARLWRWERTADLTVAVYENVLAGRNPGQK